MNSFPVPATINDFEQLLREGTHFSYANAGGDGEFLTITGWQGINSDGKPSTRDKGDALARVILEPRLTLHGYNPGRDGSAKRVVADEWLEAHGVNVPTITPSVLYDPDYGHADINVRWVHKEIVCSANAKGRLNGFLRALTARPLVIIGPDWLVPFCDRFATTNVLIAQGRGWESLDEIEREIRAALVGLPADTVVSWSLGYLAKVLMWRMANDYPFTHLDMGACWDPYCGVLNRHGYKLPDWPEKMARNLDGLW